MRLPVDIYQGIVAVPFSLVLAAIFLSVLITALLIVFVVILFVVFEMTLVVVFKMTLVFVFKVTLIMGTLATILQLFVTIVAMTGLLVTIIEQIPTLRCLLHVLLLEVPHRLEIVLAHVEGVLFLIAADQISVGRYPSWERVDLVGDGHLEALLNLPFELLEGLFALFFCLASGNRGLAVQPPAAAKQGQLS